MPAAASATRCTVAGPEPAERALCPLRDRAARLADHGLHAGSASALHLGQQRHARPFGRGHARAHRRGDPAGGIACGGDRRQARGAGERSIAAHGIRRRGGARSALVRSAYRAAAQRCRRCGRADLRLGRRHRAQGGRSASAAAAARIDPSLEEPAGDHPGDGAPDRAPRRLHRRIPAPVRRPAAGACRLARSIGARELAWRRARRTGALAARRPYRGHGRAGGDRRSCGRAQAGGGAKSWARVA